MRNAFITGLIIGIVSGIWLFAMHRFGFTTLNDTVSPIEYVSVLIPLLGLYFGVKYYRDNENGGEISFLDALVQCFKILIVGGVIAVFIAIVYITYIAGGNNLRDFSGRMFGALLVGVVFAFGVSLLLMTKTTKID